MPEDQTLDHGAATMLLIVTIVVCFGVLGWLAKLTYSDAPPIPRRVVGPDGAVLFTAADVAAGQQVFLRYGLMENGTIWEARPIWARIFGPISSHARNRQ